MTVEVWKFTYGTSNTDFTSSVLSFSGFQGRQKGFGHSALRDFGGQVGGGGGGVHGVSPVVAGQGRQIGQTAVYAAKTGLAVRCQTSCSHLVDNRTSL